MNLIGTADPWTIALCVAALVAGGVVKGMTAVGLPLVAVPALAALMPVPQALALIALPSMATSLWQVFHGGHHRAASSRIVAILAGLVVGMPVSVRLLATVDMSRLHVVLGIIVTAFAAVLFRRVVITVAPRHEWWAGALTGLIAGLIGGVSLFVGPIFAMYLAGLKLDRHVFVASISIVNLAAAALFALLLASYGIASGGEFALSGIATLIVFAGLFAGQRLRVRVNEEAFRKTLAVVLLATGLNLLRKALFP